MKLKYFIILIFLMVVLSGCTSFSSKQPTSHVPPNKSWEITDNLAISDKDFNLEVLQIIVMPKHITLICAISGFQANNDLKVDVSNQNQVPSGQANITTIREFAGGKLVAFTFTGNRQQMSTPHFSIGKWDIAPLHLPQDGMDKGGTFMSGVASANIGDVTIFSSGNSDLDKGKGDDFFGGPDNIASFRMKASENGKDSWIYLLVSANGNVSEISEDEYMNIPLKYMPTSNP